MAKNILVVDDNFEDLEAMKAILERAGYAVTGATNGTQALELIKKNGFVLILIDIYMPSLSGYDLLRIMREKINHDSAMAFVSIAQRRDVDISDADGFIQKPFTPRSLVDGVQQALASGGKGKAGQGRKKVV